MNHNDLVMTITLSCTFGPLLVGSVCAGVREARTDRRKAQRACLRAREQDLGLEPWVFEDER